jgi:hypothetical protein
MINRSTEKHCGVQIHPAPTNTRVVAGQWAGLIAKDVWQDALCSIWDAFVTQGLKATRTTGVGLTWDETRELVRSLATGSPALDPAMPTSELISLMEDGGIDLVKPPGEPLASARLESLRLATHQLSTATSGLVVVLELYRRAAARSDPGWLATSTVSSAWQPSVADVFVSLRDHLGEEPAISDTLWWIVDLYVIRVHERIALLEAPRGHVPIPHGGWLPTLLRQRGRTLPAGCHPR